MNSICVPLNDPHMPREIDKKKKKDQIRNRIQLKGFQGTGKDLAVNNIENILTYGTMEEAHEEARIMKIIQLPNK